MNKYIYCNFCKIQPAPSEKCLLRLGFQLISSNRKFPETVSNKFVKFGDFAEVANFSQAPPTCINLNGHKNVFIPKLGK